MYIPCLCHISSTGGQLSGTSRLGRYSSRETWAVSNKLSSNCSILYMLHHGACQRKIMAPASRRLFSQCHSKPFRPTAPLALPVKHKRNSTSPYSNSRSREEVPRSQFLNATPSHRQHSVGAIFAAGFRQLLYKLQDLAESRAIRWLVQSGIAFLLLTHYVVNTRTTSGPSMLPTIAHEGDSVLVCWLYARGKGVKAGDIITYESPIHRGSRGVKRVVAMEGDYVLRDTPGGLNGDVEGWAWDANEKEQGERRDEMMIKVPQGHCWIVGDNMSWSRDSRMFGPLPLALIKGKVLAVKQPGLPWAGWIDKR